MSATSKVLWAFVCTTQLLADGPTTARREFTAPPVPPAPVQAEGAAVEPPLRAAATTYSIGDPTPEEQLYVEMINRARANPSAEATIFATTTDPDVVGNYTFFDVDLAMMQAQFAEILPAPPVALNAQLIAAARRHSADMLAKSFQEHVGSDGSTFVQRVNAAGYSFSTIAENVYANADSVFQGHAGFEVDWGFGPGGMQTPPGHRNTIHNATFREVGVGVVFGRNQPEPGSQVPGSREVGPQLVTQEFGTRQGSTPLITGVVYFDLNGNNFYDMGEGVGGVRVQAAGTATEGITARSGGYALPVAGNGSYTVTFSKGFTTSFVVQVTQGRNQKLDFRPTYSPPVVSGTTSPATNRLNNYQISAVAAADVYQWRSFQLAPPTVEGAENGTNRVTVDQVGTYPLLETRTRKSGAFSFHFAHPVDGITDQSMVLNPSYVISANSTLWFESRLGWATENQTALVQVSSDNGGTWETVYSQSGISNRPGETAFVTRSVNLAQFAGKTIRVRFAYIPTGQVYVDTDQDTGWFIDDIVLVNASEISGEQIHDATGPSFAFQPTIISDFVLQARARTGHDYLPWGPSLTVRSVEGTALPPELSFGEVRVANGQLELDLELVGGTAPGSLTLQTKSTLGASWVDIAATVENISSTRYRLRLPAPSSGNAFYRVRAN